MVGSPARLRGVSASQPDVDPRRYRDVLGRFVTGVTVITSAVETPQGIQPWGTTVNAFTSVSLEPPLVLICVGRARSIHPVIDRAQRFAVNILAEESQGLSDCFAGAPSPLPRSAFCGASYALSASGLPILDAAVAHLECTVEKTLDAGDHTIYLSPVIAPPGRPPPAAPLLPRPLPAHRACRDRGAARQAGQPIPGGLSRPCLSWPRTASRSTTTPRVPARRSCSSTGPLPPAWRTGRPSGLSSDAPSASTSPTPAATRGPDGTWRTGGRT